MTQDKAAKRIIPIVDHDQLAQARQAAQAPLEFRQPPPLSLYVHVPWCVQKCPYCDFNSHQVRGDLPEADYVKTLIADLESALPQVWGRRVHSVFFGGGTPSLLSGQAIDTLLSAIRTLLPLAPDAEITLEANPGIVDSDKFAAFRAAGVNRLSLGIQSFDAAQLRALGRIHDDRQARAAIEIAARHFDNFNLDLMYGLPGQTLAQALADLDSALAGAPKHLSCYQLTLEPNTAFAVSPPRLPEPDDCADMQEAIEARLAAAGYRHYETSAFAQPGDHCRHNVNYWTFGDYLGIGAGAHGKLTLHDRVVRQTRWKQPRQYMEKVATGQALASESIVDRADLPFEFMLNALRLNDGFAAQLFSERTALPLLVVEDPLRRAESEGLIRRTDGLIAPTLRGQRHLNRLLGNFLAE